MKRQKIYNIGIIILSLASILASVFLPYLHLSKDNEVETSYQIDYDMAALGGNYITRIAREEGIAKTIVYNTAKSIVQGKADDAIKNRLKEEEYYVIDIVRKQLQSKVSELEEIGQIDKVTYSMFSLIGVSNYVIKHLEQDVMSAYLVMFTLIITVILNVLLALCVLKKYKNYYQLGKIISLLHIVVLAIGMVSVNGIAIGALQLDKFQSSNWGINWFLLIASQLIIFVVSFIGDIDRKYAGLITWKTIMKQKELILMTIPFVVYALIFNYGPLVGWTMAFQNFKPASKGAQVWIAWEKFETLFSDFKFLLAFRNTIAMSVINLVLSTVISIVFALLLNEVMGIKRKKVVQTISYLPHFLSWIIVAAIVRNVLSLDGGIINELLVNIGILKQPINFFSEEKYFWWIVGFAVVWKETGWNSIIYLSSITSINPDLYESASIDGAGRLQKMKHITLPGIKPTIMVLLIINLGMIMNSGFEAQYQLKNDLINNTAEVIDTYVLNKSFYQGADWSIGTAAGIFKSVISIALITVANYIAKVFDQERLY